MANQLFQGYVFDDTGTAVVGATVNLYDRNAVTPVRATTTTDATGLWTISHATEGRFDVEIVSGSSKRRRKYDDQIQVDTIEVANLNIRNPADTFDYSILPAAITADRTLTLPLITGTDTLATLGLAQTFSALKTFTLGVQVTANFTDTTVTAGGGAITVVDNRVMAASFLEVWLLNDNANLGMSLLFIWRKDGGTLLMHELVIYAWNAVTAIAIVDNADNTFDIRITKTGAPNLRVSGTVLIGTTP